MGRSGVFSLSRRAWKILAATGVVVAACAAVAPVARAALRLDVRGTEASPDRRGDATFTLPPLPTTTAAAPSTTAAPTTSPTPTTHPAPRTTTAKPAPAPKPPVGPIAGDLGARIVTDAHLYVGVPYLWGGVTTAGMDCSGLVYRVLHDLGVTGVPRTADDQMRWTTRISRAAAQPGDLVFGVYSSGYAHHVGIVVGDGLMIDAPDVGQTVGVHAFYADSTVFGRVPG